VTLREALKRAKQALDGCAIEDSKIVAEVLLRHILQIDRVNMLLRLDAELNNEEQKAFFKLIERRVRGEPTSYITGHKEFYGLDFHVDPRVLIPRPESELLIDEALEFAKECESVTVSDIGTGSGAIAISIAVNASNSTVYAVDISSDALEVAKANCLKHRVSDRVVLLHGDMLNPLPGAVDVIIANLPYVSKKDVLSISSGFEPSLALDGGEDGLVNISKLCKQIQGKLKPGGWLLLEVGQGQAATVTEYLRRLFPGALISIKSDLACIERIVKMKLTKN